nr:MAG TPA: hypothetical protein [Crassvirales sp.]
MATTSITITINTIFNVFISTNLFLQVEYK